MNAGEFEASEFDYDGPFLGTFVVWAKTSVPGVEPGVTEVENTVLKDKKGGRVEIRKAKADYVGVKNTQVVYHGA